jgi:hypothetical protein
MISWPFTHSRTPSLARTVNVWLPLTAAFTLPLQRTEKLSAGTAGFGDPLPQSKFTVPSVRVNFSVFSCAPA